MTAAANQSNEGGGRGKLMSLATKERRPDTEMKLGKHPIPLYTGGSGRSMGSEKTEASPGDPLYLLQPEVS